MIYFSPVWDISTFNRIFSLHYACRTECTRFPLSKKAQTHANRNHSSIYTNLCVIPLPIEIFRGLNALFTALCVQDVVFDCSLTSKQAQTQANRNHSSILSKFMRNFSPDRDFSSFKRSFNCIMRAERSAWLFCNVETSLHTSKSQSFVDSDNNYALFLSRLRYFVV